jgi:hypothetical protein
MASQQSAVLAPSPILSMRCIRALIGVLCCGKCEYYLLPCDFEPCLGGLRLRCVVGRLCGVARHDGGLNLRFCSLEPSGLATVTRPRSSASSLQLCEWTSSRLKLCARVWCSHGDFNLVDEGGFDIGSLSSALSMRLRAGPLATTWSSWWNRLLPGLCHVPSVSAGVSACEGLFMKKVQARQHSCAPSRTHSSCPAVFW